jgi:hypothetical protein
MLRQQRWFILQGSLSEHLMKRLHLHRQLLLLRRKH